MQFPFPGFFWNCLFIHNLFLPFSYPFHTLFKPASYPFHTLFMPLSYPFHTSFMLCSYPFHTLFIPLLWPFRSRFHTLFMPCSCPFHTLFIAFLIRSSSGIRTNGCSVVFEVFSFSWQTTDDKQCVGVWLPPGALLHVVLPFHTFVIPPSYPHHVLFIPSLYPCPQQRLKTVAKDTAFCFPITSSLRAENQQFVVEFQCQSRRSPEQTSKHST